MAFCQLENEGFTFPSIAFRGSGGVGGGAGGLGPLPGVRVMGPICCYLLGDTHPQKHFVELTNNLIFFFHFSLEVLQFMTSDKLR